MKTQPLQIEMYFQSFPSIKDRFTSCDKLSDRSSKAPELLASNFSFKEFKIVSNHSFQVLIIGSWDFYFND